MSISIPPIPEPVAEAYAKIMYRSGDRTDICEKCVHKDGCEDRETFHKNHPESAIYFCSGYERQKTNADRIRQMTDEEIEEWYWWMHKEMMRYTDSRIFVHDWLKSPGEVEQT